MARRRSHPAKPGRAAAPPSGEHEHARRLTELRTLQELTRILSSSLDLGRVVDDVTAYARRLLGGGGAATLLAADAEAVLHFAAAEGDLAPHAGRRVAAEEGLAFEAVALEKPLSREAGPSGSFPLAGDITVGSAAVAPLRAHGVTAGVLVVTGRPGSPFTPEDCHLLETVATHAAVVLTNARFFDLLQRGKRQWEATFDALGEGIVLVDDAGRVMRANSGFAQVAGEPLPAAIGRNVSQVLFGDAGALEELLAEARAGRRPRPLERRSERDGRILRVAAGPIATEVAGGSAVVTVEDITERKALETQLIQSEKMAAVGTLISGVAHELNNPLTSIAGLAELLLELRSDEGPHREHLRVIHEQAERASRIVRNLLTFSRKGPVGRELVDLGDVVQRTLLLMGYELKLKGVAVETTLAPGLPPVLGERHQLQQVVLNLLSNAAQALASLPPGERRRIDVSVRGDDARVTLRVADTGPGIPADRIQEVFSPFFTTKAPGEGTGLGLFISFGIVESHGGTIAVEPSPGGGATFVIHFPRVPEGVPAPDAEEESFGRDAAETRPGRRILVVDDDPAVRRLVSVLFTQEGHQVDAVASGAEGLELARARPYELVLADRLAAAGGVPFHSALARERPDLRTRIVVSVADAAPGATEGGGVREGRVLRKPFTIKDLRAAAAAVWRG